MFVFQSTEVRLGLSAEARVMNGRVCWIQKRHHGPMRDVWAVDHVRLYPVFADVSSHYVQFMLNMKCGHRSGSAR